MSIWSSVGEPIRALNSRDDDANYRAEGPPTMDVDVAWTSYHDHIRLAIWDDDGHATEAVLSPAAARELRQKLAEAVSNT